MSLSQEDDREDLILKIIEMVDHKLPANDATLVKAFLEQYYLGVSIDDLCNKNILDLYGALMSQWHFISKRVPDESKIRVYNPQQEQHGWQSVHTVIEIAHNDKPFLLDTVRLALNRLEHNIHLIIYVEGIKFVRDAKDVIIEVLPVDYLGEHTSETIIYIEIDRQSDELVLKQIHNMLAKFLLDVDLMVRDWRPMLERLTDTIIELEKIKTENNDEYLSEIILFLHWLKDNNFTFIGYAESTFETNKNGGGILKYVDGSGLGVLSGDRVHNTARDLDQMYPGAKKMILNDEIMLIGKTDTLATVHRPAYTDFVAIKFFNKNGQLSHAIRFIGLYTATAYNNQSQHIPFVRKKIDRIFSMSEFNKEGHDGRELLHIIENLPRDDLFHARDIELYDFALGILHLQERQKIRAFIRRDIYGRYFSCLVFVPREIFNSELRTKMQNILLQELDGNIVSFDTKFSESILARIHFIDPVLQFRTPFYATDPTFSNSAGII